jgi:DNA-cytosine methyltransferase
MEKIRNVLSLFDGMSCGQIALNKAGIKYKNYFASEIKKHGIQVTQYNFPNTIQLGDIRNIRAEDLPEIDLIIGGSPCQDFSIANRERKGLQGEKSSLFFEYLRLLKECKPTYFLLENVSMDSYSENFISECLETKPNWINSSLVSAQLRNRLYWVNFGIENSDLFGNKEWYIPQPKDKGILLKDILEYGYVDRDKARCILESENRGTKNQERMYRRYKTYGFSNIVYDSSDFDYKKGIRQFTQTELERLQTVPEGYTKILTRNQAAGVLGDGWTVDVIAHIFSFIK